MRIPDLRTWQSFVCLFVLTICVSFQGAIAQEAVTAVSVASSTLPIEAPKDSLSKHSMDVHINPLKATDVISIQITTTRNSIESIDLVDSEEEDVLSVTPISYKEKSNQKGKVYNYSLLLPVGHLSRDFYQVRISTGDRTYYKSLELVYPE